VTDFFSMMEKLQGMLESDDVEVITNDGRSVRGRIDNLRSTQPFSRPAVKITGPDGKITKILFADIKEVINEWKEIAPGAHLASADNATSPAPETLSSRRGDV
jgi:hypothetical protein